MVTKGAGYIWKSYTVYSGPVGSQYELTLYRITADDAGTAIDATNGPLLLIHGFGSDSLTWFESYLSGKAVGT